MTEPITLTTYEIEELKQHITTKAPLSDPLDVIYQVIHTLNKLREPLPIGTVRVDGDGNVAVKVSDYASDQWYVHRLESARCSSHESDEYLADWPIVHKPAE